MTRRNAVSEEFLREEGIRPAQLNFILSLLDERDLRQSDKVVAATDEEYAAAIIGMKASASELTKRAASAWIDRLLTFPHLPRERNVQRGSGSGVIPSESDMPTGRYAIENEDGELRFYRFWRGTKNPGFVKLYVEHGPTDSEVPFRSALSIIAKIAEAGPFDCARRYGAEIGCCSRCGLRLTNRVSRLLAIGPICGGRFWSDESEWKSRVSEARRTLRDAGLDPAGNVEDDDNFDYGQE